MLVTGMWIYINNGRLEAPPPQSRQGSSVSRVRARTHVDCFITFVKRVQEHEVEGGNWYVTEGVFDSLSENWKPKYKKEK